MNLFNIIRDIETLDPEIADKMNPRRAALKSMTSFGSKVALSSLPFALGSFFNTAKAQSTSAVNDVLNFALTLEYLEAEFYVTGVAKSGLIPAGPALTAITKIRDDENAHVAFLKSVLGSAAVAKPTFDFTAGGAFADVFTNYATFLAVAQTFEDTGVRAYKGQAPALLGNKVYLTAALSIHSVEARHASHIRQMRKSTGQAPNIKPWITGANDTGVAAVAKSFAGEDNVTQGGVNITTLNGVGGKISTSAATEAFDEPLTKAAILEIVSPFIK
ncbi:MAG: ferritin-like domain-containing protein [Pelobium sp.]